jgi:uncharacterized protein (TIGR03066 family)
MNYQFLSFASLILTTVCLCCAVPNAVAQDKAPDKVVEKPAVPAIDQEKLIGKWRYAKKAEGLTVVGTTEFKKDGTMVGKGQLTLEGKTAAISLEGTWKLIGDILEQRVTKSNVPEMLPVGTVTKDKVLKLSDTQFTYVDEDSAEHTEKRVDEKPTGPK